MGARNPKDVEYVSSRCCVTFFLWNSNTDNTDKRHPLKLEEKTMLAPHKFFLFSIVLFSLLQATQDPKQALNDQLFEAVRKGDAAAVTALLDKGADVNAKFRYGQTALFKAVERGHTNVVKVLLDRGADVIKFATTGGVNSGTALATRMFADEARALVDTAHAYGRKVAVHAHGAEDATGVVKTVVIPLKG